MQASTASTTGPAATTSSGEPVASTSSTSTTSTPPYTPPRTRYHQKNYKYTFTLGRPPWYPTAISTSSENLLLQQPSTSPSKLTTSSSSASSGSAIPGVRSGGFQRLVLGVAGGTASGKSSVCEAIVNKLQIQWVSHLSLDSFYRGLTHDEDPSKHNWDHPDAFDWELVKQTLRQLKAGKKVEVPIYDFCTHSRSSKTKTVYGADVILFEGILSFHDREVRDLMDIKIFVDEAADIRLARRIRRDISERGRDVMGVIQQYERFVKPAHEDFVRPTMQHADIIVPKGKANFVAINLIAKHIENVLLERSHIDNRLRSSGSSLPILPKVTTKRVGAESSSSVEGAQDWRYLPSDVPPNIKIMQQTQLLRSLHTQIRNKDASQNDFIFFSHRLSRLVIEEALNHLPVEYEAREITTPTNVTYQGIDIHKINDKVVFVSVMRAGEAMEEAAREVLFAAPIGKILIQSHGQKKPELFYFNIPKNLDGRFVIVMDPTLATGESLKMAIRVILDHDVPPHHILVATLVASPQGLQALSAYYPNVTILTSAIDEDLDENHYIRPGIGNFGDRYYGTGRT